ncbi:MAG: DUF5320 domain-containing protein [Planctomycetes bacterium]|nr:DUF5320 domain-containing protein [Planctomycetota bacterium]
MPRGDGTGPLGAGPMTGRAAGYCAGFGMPGYANPLPGGGFGRGRGFWGRDFGGGGRGWRHRFYATGLPGWARPGAVVPPYAVPYATPYAKPDPELEKQALRHQADALASELEAIKKRLSELESGASAESRA